MQAHLLQSMHARKVLVDAHHVQEWLRFGQRPRELRATGLNDQIDRRS